MTSLADVGVETFEVTAIDRDGLGTGPDLDLYRGLVDRGVGRIVASGGVATTADIAQVRSIGCAGAIIGRALYDGRLRLADASSPQDRLGHADRGGQGTRYRQVGVSVRPQNVHQRGSRAAHASGCAAAHAGTESKDARTQRTPLS